MRHRQLSGLVGLALLSALAPIAAAAEEAGRDALAPGGATGHYQVSGETVDKATGARRAISGSITVHHRGEAYSASFDLRTALPGAHVPPIEAQVVGTGTGKVTGRTLRGKADTQMLTPLPGSDPRSVDAVRRLSARIRSRSVAEIAADGSISIEIENEPAPGDPYQPTHTLLEGERIRPDPDASP
jgi:hypothetical protein